LDRAHIFTSSACLYEPVNEGENEPYTHLFSPTIGGDTEGFSPPRLGEIQRGLKTYLHVPRRAFATPSRPGETEKGSMLPVTHTPDPRVCKRKDQYDNLLADRFRVRNSFQRTIVSNSAHVTSSLYRGLNERMP